MSFRKRRARVRRWSWRVKPLRLPSLLRFGRLRLWQRALRWDRTDHEAKGWVVFTENDHAAAAKAVGLDMKPRTVIIFGNPKVGTAPMQKSATLAIDNPPKALVWQDDQGKVWLTYNSGEFLGSTIYPRHGLSMPAEAIKSLEQLLIEISNQATE